MQLFAELQSCYFAPIVQMTIATGGDILMSLYLEHSRISVSLPTPQAKLAGVGEELGYVELLLVKSCLGSQAPVYRYRKCSSLYKPISENAIKYQVYASWSVTYDQAGANTAAVH
jgi:hypothetical protein